MKITIPAKEFKNAIAAMLAMHDYGSVGADRYPCVLTVTQKGLQIESASLGAYFCQLIEGKVFREGFCGMDAKEMSIHKYRGDVTLNLPKSDHPEKQTLKVSFGRAVVQLSQDTQAVEELKEAKKALPKVKAAARIPSLMLKSAVEYTALAALMKAEVYWQARMKPGVFECATNDNVSFARYQNKSNGVEVREPIQFVLLSGLMDRVLKEVNDEAYTTIGLSKDETMVRFSSDDFLLYHPAIDREIKTWETILDAITSTKLDCTFTATPEELKTAINTVKAVRKGDKGLNIQLRFGKQIVFRAGSSDHGVDYTLLTNDIKTRKSGEAWIKEAYFSQFATAAPDVELRVQLHDERYLLLEAEMGDNVHLQYSVVQSGA